MADPRKKKTSRIPEAEVSEFLREARERYTFGLEVDRIDREAAQADNQFANASDLDKEQWEKEQKASREKALRPVLQWNRIPTYIQQVVNEGRQNKPSIKIAAGDGGDPKTAEFFQSRIRHIEYEANADTARDTARDQQVTSGRGFIRYGTEYVQGSFRQRVTIESIENQFSVVWDPASNEYDRSDAEWCFVVERISKDAHERKYGTESIVSRVDFAGSDNPAPEWIGIGDNGKLIQIAQYWRKEYQPRTLVEIGVEGEPGLPVWKDELPADFQPQHILQEREEQEDVTICPYVINGAEILDETEWIGSSIPIVPLWGRTATVNGRRETVSLIRNAKDPQRSVNFFVSNIAEQIAMMPKTPWIVPFGAIPAHLEDDWAKAGTEPKGLLYYLAWDADNNRPFPEPKRQVTEPPIVALTQGLAQAIDGIKAAMGIFDPSLGNQRAAEKSGIAIQRLQNTSSITNFHFADNEARSRKREGEILIELIQKIDTVGSNVPVRSEDGKTTLVPIGKPYDDPKTGEPVTHHLTEGDYGVTVAMGKTYQSARQEANERDSNLIQAIPELIWIIGDKYFASDDTPGSEDLAERMKKAIELRTPQLIDDPAKKNQQIPQAAQQQIAQLTQKLQVTDQFAQSLHQKLESKQPELENAVKLKQMDLDFKREELAEVSRIALVKAGVQADVTRLEAEIEGIKHERQLAADAEAQASQQQHQQQMAGDQQGHEQQMQSGDQAGDQQLQQGDQQHEADQADQDRQAAAEQAAQQPKPKAA